MADHRHDKRADNRFGDDKPDDQRQGSKLDDAAFSDHLEHPEQHHATVPQGQHPYRSLVRKDRELYIAHALLAGGGLVIPIEEAPARTAERVLAIVEEIVKQAQVKGWIDADPKPTEADKV